MTAGEGRAGAGVEVARVVGAAGAEVCGVGTADVGAAGVDVGAAGAGVGFGFGLGVCGRVDPAP